MLAHAPAEVSDDGGPDRLGPREDDSAGAEGRDRRRFARRVRDRDLEAARRAAPGDGVEAQADEGIDALEENPIGRLGVEIDPREPRLLGEGVGERVLGDEALDDEDGAEERVLPALGGERGVERLRGEPAGAHQHLAEVGRAGGRRGGLRNLQRQNLSHIRSLARRLVREWIRQV